MSDVRGIGLDLCEISRMEAQLQNPRFMARVFTADEAAYINSRGQMAAASMAGLWAAKEAALKAFGVGIALPMTDVEILHTKSGQPRYVLHGQALALSEGGRLHLSITHEGGMAAAVCIWSAP